MGIFDKMINTIANKVMIDTAVNAAVKTASTVADYNIKRERAGSKIIRVPNSSDHYFGMNYKNAQDELTAYGFINIALLPKRDLIKGWLTKDGAIERVSINGKTEFKEKGKFPADAQVVITYHTFRDSKVETRQGTIPDDIEEIPVDYCSNCGAQMATNAKFCLECGLPITSASSGSSEYQQEYSEETIKCPDCGEVMKQSEAICNACGYELHSSKFDSSNASGTTNSNQRQNEFKGKIIKCPNCGEVLKSFEGICPSCGHELSSVKMSASFKTFVDGITACDASIARSPIPPKKGFRTWSSRGKFWWVVLNIFTLCIPLAIYLIMPLLGIWGGSSFLPDEKRKAALIKNYAFPNDRESVLEILIYIKSQMAFIASGKIDRRAVHWASIWGHKAEQIDQKAEIIIKGDTISASVYSDIMMNWKKIKKSFGIRVSIAFAFIVVLIVVRTVSSGPFGLPSNPFKNISNSFVETFEWPDTELSRLLPQPESDKGEIHDIDAESLWIEVHDFSISKFERYINSCKEKGFYIEGERQGNTYKAHNDRGYRLDLNFTQYNSEMTIHLNVPKVIAEFQWPSTEIGNLLPVPESNKGEISRSDEEQLRITVYNLSEDQCNAYIEACKENGFTIDSKIDSISYKAYNESGFYLELHYYKVSEHGFYIVCDAPMKMETIRWPKTDLVNEIPMPKSIYGKIDSETRTSFTVYIGNITSEEYADYVDACIERGFTKGLYRRDKTEFHGDNSKDSKVSVDYIGFNIMKIHIYNFDY